MITDRRSSEEDEARRGVLLSLGPESDEAQELAVARAIAREALVPGEPPVLRSPWWLAGLEHATDRTP